MAAYISFQPKDYFGAKLYSGTGSTQSITGVGFQPDWTWIKGRSYSSNNVVYDTTRGVLNTIMTNNSDAQSTDSGSLTAWGADGFTVGTAGASNSSGQTYASWNWRMGTTSGITTNGSTTITPSTYSFNATTGVSVVKYTGNGTSGAKIAHGLGVAPDIVIVKRTGSGGSWDIVSKYLGATYYMRLDTTIAKATGTWAFNDTLPDSVNFTVGDNAETNSSDGNVAYCFANKRGYFKSGLYEGNGNTNGIFINTGFRPQFFISKETNSTDPWHSWTGISSTSGANKLNKSSQPNDGSQEATDNSKDVDFLSNGVKLRTSNAEINGSGSPYIYMAWAASPLVSSNSKAGTAR